MCGTVRKYGAQHHAHLRGDGIVEDGLRFKFVPENHAAIAVLDFLDKARFCPVAVLALENLSGEERLVSGRDFAERNFVHAERHAEHLLQLLADTDVVCEPRVFRHGKRTAVVGPVAQMFGIQVVDFGVGRLHHGGEPLEIGERHVRENIDAVERHQRRCHVGVEFAGFAGAEDFGVVLVVVVQHLEERRVFLGLLDADIGVGTVAHRLDGACLGVLAFVPVPFYKGVARLREFDFALDFFLHGEPELVAQSFVEGLVFFVGVAGEPVLRGDFFKLGGAQLVEQVFQQPDARDVFGAGGGPGDAHDFALVLVVGAREVELVHVLENVVFVFEFVQVVPVVLQGECVKDRLPAGPQLA